MPDGIPRAAPAPDRTVAVLVPVKAFSQAKVRLAPALDPAARAALARRMAGVVLDAAGALPTAVVCDDVEVRTWARDRGTRVIWTPGLGLDGAVEAGVERLSAEGVERVVVAHGDLPLATELGWVADGSGVTLVPDRRFDGTNVACVPARAGFRFAYGPGSFRRHRAEAARLGLVCRLVADPRLGGDVDLPDDLDLPVGSMSPPG
jgi:2-phospho-L-lactate/phosphoenolpyruvate guanylyltransferase